MAEVERELNEAQHRVENAKAVYELIVRRMSEELARFQRERAAELGRGSAQLRQWPRPSWLGTLPRWGAALQGWPVAL